MKNRYSGLLILFASLLALYSTGAQSKSDIIIEPGLSASTLFSAHYQKEPVTITLHNFGYTAVTLPNSAPWNIVDATSGQVVYTPISLQVFGSLAPGESKQWTWNQRTNEENYVLPGDYRVMFSVNKATADFSISEELGSGGFFTFLIGQGLPTKFRVLMTNPYSIRDTIDSYYGRNAKTIPLGTIVDDRPGKSPYDPQWSWHMDPSSIVMAELAMEVCDGHPIYVEDNLDYWLQSVGIYCPWNATIILLDGEGKKK